MDFIAHGLWTYIFFHEQDWIWIGILLGFFLDAITFIPVSFAMMLKGERPKGKKPQLKGKFARNWAKVYNATHSLVVMTTVGIVLYIITGSVWGPLFAWLLHILMDIPTHTKDFFPTPILWPLSKWTIGGFSWAAPWFMALNYGAILIGLLYIFL